MLFSYFLNFLFHFGFAELRKRCVANYQKNSSHEIENTPPYLQPSHSRVKMSFEYRREALEYALNVDRAILRLDSNDKNLVRSASTEIGEHIKTLRSKMRPVNKPLYPALRTLKQNNIDAVSEIIRDAKYGADKFEQVHLEKCKNLVDELVELINYSSGLKM